MDERLSPSHELWGTPCCLARAPTTGSGSLTSHIYLHYLRLSERLRGMFMLAGAFPCLISPQAPRLWVALESMKRCYPSMIFSDICFFIFFLVSLLFCVREWPSAASVNTQPRHISRQMECLNLLLELCCVRFVSPFLFLSFSRCMMLVKLTFFIVFHEEYLKKTRFLVSCS